MDLFSYNAIPGYNPSNYKSERHWVLAKDGVTKIPLTIAYKIDKMKFDGTNPVVINGYGNSFK